jgi:hypothetical protein
MPLDGDRVYRLLKDDYTISLRGVKAKNGQFSKLVQVGSFAPTGW